MDKENCKFSRFCIDLLLKERHAARTYTSITCYSPLKVLDIKPDFKLETERDSSSDTDSDNRTDWSPILFGIIRVINKIG